MLDQRTSSEPHLNCVAPHAARRVQGQRATVVWFTGRSGAGKSTIAALVWAQLQRRRRQVVTLDGDQVRLGLSQDLGFSDADRTENIRRISETAKLATESGMLVLVSVISPFEADRQAARALFEPGAFIEVYVDTPLEVAQHRDPKGLYQRAQAGEICNMTGVGSPYEEPLSPELRLDTILSTPQECADAVIATLFAEGRLDG